MNYRSKNYTRKERTMKGYRPVPVDHDSDDALSTRKQRGKGVLGKSCALPLWSILVAVGTVAITAMIVGVTLHESWQHRERLLIRKVRDTTCTCSCKCANPTTTTRPTGKPAFSGACRNLTKEDAPKYGGFVCHWNRRDNSQQCTQRCNKGYEFAGRHDSWLSCGPATAYRWPLAGDNTRQVVSDCVEEFFSGFQLEAEEEYFANSCKNLTNIEKQAVFQTLKTRLDESRLCKNPQNTACNVKDMKLVCGEV